MTVIVSGMIRSALAHLSITNCPRCLRGTLVVDLDRRALTCSKRCPDVAGAVGEAARALRGGFQDEGAALLELCVQAQRRRYPDSVERIYVAACELPESPAREAILRLSFRLLRAEEFQRTEARAEIEAEKVAA